MNIDWKDTRKIKPTKNGMYLVFFQHQQTFLEFTSRYDWHWGDGTPMASEYQRDVTHWDHKGEDPS